MRKISTVFLVDDDAIFKLLLKVRLKKILPNIQIYDFKDGQEALAQINHLMPDLVFLDLDMPNFDGWDFLDALEKTSVNFDIYITTILDYEASFERFIKNPLVKNLLFKPIKYDVLKELLLS